MLLSEHAAALLLNMSLMTLFTFGDSILDCAKYNPHRVSPAALLLRNDDTLFPQARGQDLASRGLSARLVHRAADGTTTAGLAAQLKGVDWGGQGGGAGMALVTAGGNDLLQGCIANPASTMDVERVAARLEGFLQQLPLRPVLLGNVYDPSFGDDRLNFLPGDPQLLRRNLLRYKLAAGALCTLPRRLHCDLGQEMAPHYGVLVDIHAHFLAGETSWLTNLIEPSLEGASQVRLAFLPHVLAAADRLQIDGGAGGCSAGAR